MNPKQAQFLNTLQKNLEGGAVQPDELLSVIQTIFAILGDLKKNLESSIEAHHGVVTDQTQGIGNDIAQLTNHVITLRDRVSSNHEKISNETSQQIQKIHEELARIEASIPSLPDNQPIVDRINEVESKIPTLPDPVTLDSGEQIVEKINELPTDDNKLKIDASHIKNLPRQIQNQIGGMGHPIAGQNISVSGQVINLSIPIQPTAPGNPNQGDFWVDNS